MNRNKKTAREQIAELLNGDEGVRRPDDFQDKLSHALALALDDPRYGVEGILRETEYVASEMGQHREARVAELILALLDDFRRSAGTDDEPELIKPDRHLH